MPVDPTLSETRFVVDAARRELRLDHPALDAAWTWDDEGRVIAVRLGDRRMPGGVNWVDPAVPSRLYDRPLPAVAGRPNDPQQPFLGPPHAGLESPAVEGDGGVARARWRMT